MREKIFKVVRKNIDGYIDPTFINDILALFPKTLSDEEIDNKIVELIFKFGLKITEGQKDDLKSALSGRIARQERKKIELINIDITFPASGDAKQIQYQLNELRTKLNELINHINGGTDLQVRILPARVREERRI